MFQLIRSTIQIMKLTAVFTVVAFLVSGLFTLNMDGNFKAEAGCVIAATSHHGGHGSQAVCPMKVGEHLTWWNKTFTSIPTAETLSSLILLLGGLLAVIIILKSIDNFAIERIRFVSGVKDPPENIPRDYYAVFLAAGKAQPLLYA